MSPSGVQTNNTVWGWDWTSGSANDVSSAQPYDFSSEDTILCGVNPDIHPPSKAWCPDVHRPVAQSAGTMVWGVHEVDDGVEGELEKSMPKCVGVPWGSGSGIWIQVSLHLDIFRWFAIRLPLCRIPSNIWGTWVFIWGFGCRVWVLPHIPDTVADDRGRGVMLNSPQLSICMIGL